MAKVSSRREVNGITWRVTSDGFTTDVDAMGAAIYRAIEALVVFVDGWRPYVTHDSASEMVLEAADHLASLGVWFSGMEAETPYVVYLKRENEDSSVEVEVMTVYPERLENGEVPLLT